MTVVGISSTEQDQIFLLISAILHLGNVKFQDGEQNDSCKIINKEELETTASLLGRKYNKRR
jgi:myosin heavy subunit